MCSVKVYCIRVEQNIFQVYSDVGRKLNLLVNEKRVFSRGGSLSGLTTAKTLLEEVERKKEGAYGIGDHFSSVFGEFTVGC